MEVTIRTNELCSVCGKKFDSKKFFCKAHKTKPSRFFIDSHFNNKRKKIYCDLQGVPLSSLEQARKIAESLKPEQLDLYKPAKSNSEFKFQNFVEFYLKERAKKVNATSMTVKKNRCRFHLGRLFKDTDIRFLTRIQAQKTFDDLPENRTKQNLQDQLVAIVNFAVSKGHRSEGFKLEKVKFQPMEKASWTEEEIEKILKNIPPDKRPIYDFISTYGLRVSEAKGLLWDSVNLSKKEVTIRRAKTRSGLMQTTKTKVSRTLPMTKKMEMMFFSLRLSQGVPKDDSYVFQKRKESRLFERSLCKMWKQACKAAHVQIGDLRFLRHSFVLNRLKQGWTLQEIGAFTGDTSAILEKHYGKLKATDLKDKLEPKEKSVRELSEMIDVKSKNISIFDNLGKKDVNGIQDFHSLLLLHQITSNLLKSFKQ